MDSSTTGSRVLGGGAAVVIALAGVKLAAHLATTGAFGYGFFVDELYFLACAKHLAWGFVDMPPLFPALTALVRATLGDSLWAVRATPTLAGAALVLLTGLFARRLGGGRFGMGLAALGVLVAPIYLVGHSIHTMNALEPLLWTGAAWLLVEIVEDGAARLWLACGALAGVGLLNKHTMGVFGAAAVAALLATPARRVFRERWPWLGGLVAFVLVLPHLAWLIVHRFPHLEHLAAVARDQRDVELGVLQFLAQQVLLLHPLALPVWLAGLAWLLWSAEGRRYRVLGLAYLGVMALFLVLHGRVYYPAPAYPMLLAAGGVAIERWLQPRAWGRWARPAYAGLLALGGTLLAPTVLPCLPPALYPRYVAALGIDQPRIETHRLGPLPQLHADRFGWPEMAAEVARIYHALPPADRERAAIFGQNYGQAGAIDRFGPALGLPEALSGHLAYHDWGPRGATGEVMIVLDDDRETLEGIFASVEWAGRVEHPYSMPYQHFDVHVCRGLRMPLAQLWPRLRRLG